VDLFKRILSFGRKAETVQKTVGFDIDPFLAEVTSEHPSGDADLEYDPEFIKLEEEMKGAPEIEIGGKIVQEARNPNWHEIQKSAAGLLTRTHDLRVAMAFTRALLNTEGLVGLEAGLRLLHGFVERFWDSLYPRLPRDDDYDPTQRINILMTLCDREAMIDPLIKATLCGSPAMGGCSLRDIRKAAGTLGGPSQNQAPASTPAIIDAIFQDCDVNTLLASREVIGESLLRLSRLEDSLKEKVESERAPQFDELRLVIDEMRLVFDRQIGKHPSPARPEPGNKIEPTPPAVVNRTPPAAAGSAQEGHLMDTINSRQDVTRLLDQICLYYEKHEPASPVPFLLKRAARLVDKNFVEIVQDMAPESAAQIQKLIGGSKEK
jgi:type VI secretion system protein ImpA